MIARQDAQIEKPDVWAKLAAPLPSASISWRQDGKATARDGKFFARFVCYVEAGTVRERLDATCPGEWNLTLEPLLPRDIMEDGGSVRETEYGFKARLQVLGVIREDVGTGRDYKSASTDAFKRAAVRDSVSVTSSTPSSRTGSRSTATASTPSRSRILKPPTAVAMGTARTKGTLQPLLLLHRRTVPASQRRRLRPLPRPHSPTRRPLPARSVTVACGTTESGSGIPRPRTTSVRTAPATE
jgi:hypothetical protein